MRNVSKETITAAFLGYCSPDTPPRVREILESLVTHLHAFAKEVNLNHEEWRKGIELLMKAGEMTNPERNEFVLFSDVLGLSSLVDMINSPEGATPSSVLGPFHILGAPEVPFGVDLKRDNEGETLVVAGTIRGTDGKSVPSGMIEIWQTADNGLYSNQDPLQPEYNLRAQMNLDPQGRYLFSTVKPKPYTVPNDGPVGELLRATGRHPWRASHLHFIVKAPGYRTLVTELFPENDAYLETDAVFGVREELVLRYHEVDDPQSLPDELFLKSKIGRPVLYVNFDVSLSPVALS